MGFVVADSIDRHTVAISRHSNGRFYRAADGTCDDRHGGNDFVEAILSAVDLVGSSIQQAKKQRIR